MPSKHIALSEWCDCRHFAGGWLVALTDMPWIEPATIRLVADALRSGDTIAAPCWQGRRGHPVGFARALGAELAVLSGDAGAKAVIQVHLEQLRVIDCNDAGILFDIDQSEDLQLMKNINKPL